MRRTRVAVYVPGDPSVGIPEARVEFDLPFRLDQDDEDAVGLILAEAFSEIFDDRDVAVFFE